MTTSTVTREITLTEADDAAIASSLMDEDTFRAFYERTARSLWAYLVRIGGDRQLADDLVQETYYRFYRAGAVHDSERHRRNSLFTIATNLARDEYRRRRGIESTPLVEDLPAQSVAAGSLDARTDLARAMARLKPRQREMLWLAYAQGSTHEEIAEVVGATRGSVKSLLFRARRKLAALLMANGPVPGR